jgi:hypothetical protein
MPTDLVASAMKSTHHRSTVGSKQGYGLFATRLVVFINSGGTIIMRRPTIDTTIFGEKIR